MLRLLAEENLNNDIVHGIIRRNVTIDIVHVQDVGLMGADDPTVLAWAAQHQRVLLTHDVATITYYAYERLRAGHTMPGVFEIRRATALAQIIEDIILIAECSVDDEWQVKCAICCCNKFLIAEVIMRVNDHLH